MPRIYNLGFALGFSLLASNAHAENVTATLGFYNVNPKSNNGVLAGARANVEDDWAVTGSIAYAFADNWSVELWSGLENTITMFHWLD